MPNNPSESNQFIFPPKKMSNNEVSPRAVFSACNAIKQKQLEAYALIKDGTSAGVVTNEMFNERWNKLCEIVGERPKIITNTLMGVTHFGEGYRVNIDWATINARCAVSVKLLEFDISGNNKMSLGAWIGKHSEFVANDCVYSRDGVYNALKKDVFKYRDTDYIQNFDKVYLDTIKDTLTSMHSEMVNYARWIYRVKRKRMCSGRVSTTENITLQQRWTNIVQQIESVRPHNWAHNFRSATLNIARKLRPDGDCLGIELEFLANKGSDITNWDSDDFPTAPWLYFKGDGSIRANNDGECTVAHQELTFFMNSQSSKDWNTIKSVLNNMVTSGAKINNSCGNHVHIDMRHRTNSSALRTATKLRDAINSWAHRTVSFNRSHNHYCGIDREHRNNRYTAVNTQCLSEHNTIEVRLGMPTLNYHKLRYWCNFLQYLCRPYTSVSTLEEFMQSDADMCLKQYVFGRIMKFHDTYVNAGLPELPNFGNYRDALNNINGGVE